MGGIEDEQDNGDQEADDDGSGFFDSFAKSGAAPTRGRGGR